LFTEACPSIDAADRSLERPIQSELLSTILAISSGANGFTMYESNFKSRYEIKTNYERGKYFAQSDYSIP